MGYAGHLVPRRPAPATRAALVIEVPFVVTLLVVAVLIGLTVTPGAQSRADSAPSASSSSSPPHVAADDGSSARTARAPSVPTAKQRVLPDQSQLGRRASRQARSDTNPSPSPDLTPSMPSGTALADGVKPAPGTGWGCGAALSYLRTHADPQFRLVCPGPAVGRQAMTCFNHPPECGVGDYVIVINVPCPAAYMNEASNSWVLTDQLVAPIDPYGSCS